jgi:DNA-binding transcriptional ArsR family regulator
MILKGMFHPRAFLSRKRNVKAGLAARSRLLQVLEKQSSDVRSIVAASGLHYGVVVHHLRLLESERVVIKSDKRPFRWELTGVGQQRLINEPKEK